MNQCECNLMPLSCTLKYGENGKFYVLFYHNLFKGLGRKKKSIHTEPTPPSGPFLTTTPPRLPPGGCWRVPTARHLMREAVSSESMPY